MKKQNPSSYYEYIQNKNLNSNLSSTQKEYNKAIRTDFALFVTFIKATFLYFLLLIPNILGLLFSFLTGDKNQLSKCFSNIFIKPFEALKSLKNWFFEAKITALLIIILITVYIIEILYLGSYMQSLMTHQLHIFNGNYYSMLTSIFLHNDIIHLISNLIALLIFGRIVEKEIGFKMIFVFLSSGIIANLISNSISYMQNDLFYSLGASGAIAGLIIFAILLSPFTLTSVLIIPMPIFVIGWAIIILDFIGLTAPSSTNHLAHIGGYSALLFIFFFLELSHRKKIVAGFLINLMLIIVFLMLNSSFNLTSILF